MQSLYLMYIYRIYVWKSERPASPVTSTSSSSPPSLPSVFLSQLGDTVLLLRPGPARRSPTGWASPTHLRGEASRTHLGPDA